jgi:hypothetical protein
MADSLLKVLGTAKGVSDTSNSGHCSSKLSLVATLENSLAETLASKEEKD